MIRPATPEDRPALIAHLGAQPGRAMSPLDNLHSGRLMAPSANLPSARHMHGWLAQAQGRITGFLGLSGGGHLMPAWPGDMSGLALHLAGRQIAAAIGPDGQAPALLAALGLADAPRRHADEEPGFSLRLADLILPDVTGYRLVVLDKTHRAKAIPWRMAYLAEVFGDHDAAARADRDVTGWIKNSSHRILLKDGHPVAMTGFNARIPGTVQVGGVWTPPEARGQGLARRAVGLHLAEARAAGETTAVLFAANDAAAAAYRALGFQPQGRMGVIELATPATVPACR